MTKNKWTVSKKIIFFMVSVIMSGTAFASSLSIFPSSRTNSYATTLDSIQIVSDTNWSVTLLDPANTWVTNIAPATGAGNEVVYVTITSNSTSQTQREAELRVRTEDLSITKLYTLQQTGDTQAPSPTLNYKLTKDSQPTLTGTIDDNTATLVISVNGVSYSNAINGPGKITISGAASPYDWTLADNVIETLSDDSYYAGISATDAASNVGSSGNTLVIDTTPPALSPIHVESNKSSDSTLAKVGDQIILTFTSNESLGSTPTVTIAGHSAAVSRSGLNYTATYTMQSSDATAASVTFSISATDQAGNSTSKSATTDASSVRFDKTVPTLISVVIASDNATSTLAKVGNEITLTFSASEILEDDPTVTIAGNSAAVSASGLDYTAAYTLQSSDAEANPVTFSIAFIDAAGNAGTAVTATGDGSSVRFDKTAPTLSAVHIQSNNANTALAKVGNQISLTFTASEALLTTPTVTIDTKTATVTNSGLNYTATYTMLTADAEGNPIPFTVNFTDATGNAGVQVTGTNDASQVKFDKTKPTITSVSIASDNADNSLATTGDEITLTFVVSETLLADPIATIAGNAAIVVNTSGLNYSATYLMQGSEADDNILNFTIDASDEAGNAATQKIGTDDGSSVNFDKTAPSLSDISITSNNAISTLAKVGDEISLAFNATEALTNVSVTIAGRSAAVNNTGLAYTATYTMQSYDATAASIAFTINYEDPTGNTGMTETTTDDGSAVCFDKTAPTLSSAHIQSNNANTVLAKIANVITLTFTASETLGSKTVTIAGHSAAVTKSGLNYTATYTLQSSDTEADPVSFSIAFSDEAGNAGTTKTTTDDASEVTFDKTAPVLTTVTIVSNNANMALAKVGNLITLNFLVNETLIGNPTVTIGGNAAAIGNSGLQYTATYTMQSSDTDADPLVFHIAFTDAAGNAGTAVTSTTNGSEVVFDKTVPALSTVSIESDNTNSARAKVDDEITLSFTASEVLLNTPSVTIATKPAIVASAGGNNYTATYTMTSAESEDNAIDFSISFTDAAGNAGTPVTFTTDGSSVAYDKTLPTLTSVNIRSSNSDSSRAKVGDQITVSFTSSETLRGTPTVTIATKSASVSASGNNYTATYTMTSSESDASNPIPFAIEFLDAAGNEGIDVSSVTDASSVTFDKTAPTLTDISIVSDNVTTTLAKAGNVITLTFTAGETLRSASVTISGNSASVNNSGLDYTATYTMLSTDSDDDAIDFTINFADAAGNSGAQVNDTDDASYVKYDNSAPTLTTVSIASNNANDATLSKVDDQITVTFIPNETLMGTPSATIAGNVATVTKSGSTYYAKYTMRSTDNNDTAIDFTINFSDLTGNNGNEVSTTTDASSVKFDKTAPTLSNVSIASDNDNDQLAKVSDVITVSFTADETLESNPTVTIAGKTAAVAKSGLNYSATYTMLSGDATAAAIAFTIDFTDAAGNDGTQVTATDDASSVRFDKTKPTLTAVHIESDNADAEKATVGDVITLTFTASETLLELPAVTITSHSVTATNTGGLNYSVAYTLLTTDTEADFLPFSIDFSDAAGNGGDQVNTSTSDGSFVDFDKSAPTLSDVHIESNNTRTPNYAKIGHIITLTFSASEELIGDPDVILSGKTATVSGAGLDYTATYTMLVTDAEANPIEFTIDFTDATGNDGTQVITSSDGSEVIFDKTVPTLNYVNILSNNANSALTKVGDQITLTATPNEALYSLSSTIASRVATTTKSGDDYLNRITMQNSDAETLALSFSISFTDSAGNAGTAVTATTDASAVKFDRTAPQMTSVHIESDNANDTTLAKVNDQIILTMTANETLLANPTVTIAGHAASVTKSGLNYTARYTMTAGDDEAASVSFTINFADAAGNTATQITSTVAYDGSSVEFDQTAPTLSNVHIESNNADPALAVIGDEVTVSFTVSEILEADPTVTIAGNPAVITHTGLNYSAAYTMQSSDVTTNSIAFTIDFTDAAGNEGTRVTVVDDASVVRFDKTAPSLTDVHIESNNTYDTTKSKIGNIIYLTFTASETLISDPDVTIAGKVAAVSASGLDYTATYTMQNVDVETASLVFTVDFTDAAGNAGIQVTETTDVSSVGFDKTKPTLPYVHIETDNDDSTRAKVGDAISIIFTVSEALTANPTVIIAGQTATISYSNPYYSAVYTMTSSESDASNPVAFSVNFTDESGNTGTAVTTTTNSSAVNFDKTAPVVSAMHLVSNNANHTGYAKVGDMVTLTFTLNETLLTTPTVTVAGRSAAVTKTGLDYSAAYTMLLTDTESSDLAFTIAVTDLAGNTTAKTNPTDDGTTIVFDKTAPAISVVHIESNNIYNAALSKTGDMITLSFTSNESLITDPTVTIAGSAAAITPSGLDYDAVYTMLITDTETGAIAFTISATDIAGNIAATITETDDYSEVAFDRTAPHTSIVYSDSLVKKDDAVTITATFSEDVQTPSIALNYSGIDADLNATNMTTTLDPTVFTYAFIIPDNNNGAVDLTIQMMDEAGNTATFTDDALIVDNNLPQFTNISPSRLGFVNHQRVSFSINKTIVSGSITYRWMEGTSDPLSSHTFSIRSEHLTAGSYTDTLTASNLIDGAIYNIELTAIDSAGNSNGITGIDSVSYDITAPTINFVYNDSLVKKNDALTVALDPSETLGASPAPRITLQYAGTAILTNQLMTYQLFQGENRWVYSTTIPDGNDGQLTASVTAADRAGNNMIYGTGRTAVTVDNIFPAAFTINYVRPEPDSLNFPGYYSSKTTALYLSVPVDNTDASLLNGSIQIYMEAFDGSPLGVYHTIGDPIAVNNLLDKTISIPNSVMHTDFLDLPGVESGLQVITYADLSDKVGNITASPIALDTFYIDLIAPVAGSIYDGLTDEDIDFIQEDDGLSFTFSGFSDAHSELGPYEYAVGSAASIDAFLSWTPIDSDTSYGDISVTPVHNQRYYISLRAIDSAGNISDTLRTDGVLADFVAPLSSSTLDPYYFDTEWLVDDTIRGISSDNGSGIASLELTIQRVSDEFYFTSLGYTSELFSYNQPFNEDGSWEFPLPADWLDNRHDYRIAITATDSAGNVQAVTDTAVFQYVVNQLPHFSGTFPVTYDILEDSVFILDVYASDVDRGTISGDSLDYTWYNKPAAMTKTEVADTIIAIQWATNNNTTGLDTATLIVTDAYGAADTVSFYINVIPVNDAPESFALVQPTASKRFTKTDSIEQRFKWIPAVDIDDTTLAYTIFVSHSGGDTSFTVSDADSLWLDLPSLDLPGTVPVSWYASVQDTEYTVYSLDTLIFTIDPPMIALSLDTLANKLVQDLEYDSLLTLTNNGFQTLEWSAFKTPFFLRLDTAQTILHNGHQVISLTMNTASLPLGRTIDSLVIASNDPNHAHSALYFDLLIVNSGKVSVAIIQNPAFDQFWEFMLNDSLAQIDSLKFYLDDEPLTVTKVDSFTYIGHSEFTAEGAYTLSAVTYSFAGEENYNRELAVVLARKAEKWSGSSFNGNISVFGKSNAVFSDQYLLLTDSTAFQPEVSDGAYCIGIPGKRFEESILLRMKHSNENRAIHYSSDGKSWQELPTCWQNGEMMTWTNAMGYFKKGEKTIFVPEVTQLRQNYPNPFNPVTTIPIDIGFMDGPGQRVQCIVYNIRGQKIATLVDKYLSVGHYDIRWNGVDQYGRPAASGVYFTRIITDSGYIKSTKMVLLK